MASEVKTLQPDVIFFFFFFLLPYLWLKREKITPSSRERHYNSLLINKYTKHKLMIIRCQSQRLIWHRSESYNVLQSYNEKG